MRDCRKGGKIKKIMVKILLRKIETPNSPLAAKWNTLKKNKSKKLRHRIKKKIKY